MSQKAWSERVPLLAGFAAIVLLIGGLVAWGISSRISGAVVAIGTIQVESNRQVIQHPDGGVVGEITARDGDHVEAGDVLIQLDGTRLLSELSVVEGQLHELAARRARLRAERDGLENVSALGALDGTGMPDDPAFALQLENERVLFMARLEALLQEEALQDEQIAQIDNRVRGTQSQLDALFRQEALIDQQVSDQQALFDQGLTQAGTLLALQREQAGLQGQIGQLEAEIADLRGQAATIRIARLQLRIARREEALTQLRDLRFQLIELIEQRLALAETLDRLDVRAPMSGIVYGSTVFAKQAVVQGGAPIMYIIPQDQPLIVSTRVDAIDIADVFPGQEVALRFPSFDPRETPEVKGRLTQISADVILDEVTRQNYYAATVTPDPGSLAGLGDQTLVPGMPVEAYLTTGERSPLTYLTSPLMGYFERAFRE